MSTLELRIRNLFLAIENRDGAGTKINWSTIVIGMMAERQDDVLRALQLLEARGFVDPMGHLGGFSLTSAGRTTPGAILIVADSGSGSLLIQSNGDGRVQLRASHGGVGVSVLLDGFGLDALDAAILAARQDTMRNVRPAAAAPERTE